MILLVIRSKAKFLAQFIRLKTGSKFLIPLGLSIFIKLFNSLPI